MQFEHDIFTVENFNDLADVEILLVDVKSFNTFPHNHKVFPLKLKQFDSRLLMDALDIKYPDMAKSSDYKAKFDRAATDIQKLIRDPA